MTAPAPAPASNASGLRLPLGRLLAWIMVLAIPLAVAGEVWARFDDHRRFGIAWNASPDLNADLVVHDSMGFHGRPSGQYMGWKLNSAGFRSPEAALTARDGCRLVMTLGSSETFGYAERPGQEYPAQMADSLAHTGCYRVLNAGVVGMSLPSMLQTYQLWGARFHPDIVVLLASPMPYVYDEPPVTPTPVIGPVVDQLRSRLHPRLIGKVKELVSFPGFIQRRRVERMVENLSAGRPHDWFFDHVPPERLALFSAELTRAIEAIRATGAQAVVVVHPIKFASMHDGDARTEMQAMRQFGARPLPDVLFSFDSAGAIATRHVAEWSHAPLADMPPRMNGRHELFSDPVHYSEAGAAIMAGEIARVIAAMPRQAPTARTDSIQPSQRPE